MFRPPFTPRPYPDEILGSWLARIRLHNGVSGWRTLLKQAGFTNHYMAKLYNLVPYSSSVERLFLLLGMTYEDALLNLTTLPYRLTFNAAPIISGYLPGTQLLPKIYSDRQNSGLDLHRILPLPIGEKNIRYCSACLLSDYQIYGEPYWHRAHQLPSIQYCHLHQVELRTACPRCKGVLLFERSTYINTPRILCRCGYNLTADTDAVDLPPWTQRLSIVSIDALNNQIFTYDVNQIRNFLHHAIHQDGYLATLTAAFGEYEQDKSILLFHGSLEKPILKIKSYLYQPRPQECCALLAAIGINLDELFLSLSNTSNKFTRRTQSARFSSQTSIAQARRILLEKLKSSPTHQSPPVEWWYWFLRIRDDQWMKAHWPQIGVTHWGKIPSLHQDRKTITHRTQQMQCLTKPWVRISACPAAIRARIRDQDWLARIHSKISDKTSIRNTDPSDRIQIHISQIINTLQDLFTAPTCPRKIHLTTLAEQANLTMLQAKFAISFFPEIKEIVKLMNQSRLFRCLQWSIHQLACEGQEVTTLAVIEKAGLWYSPRVKYLAAMLVARHRREGAVVHPIHLVTSTRKYRSR
ncbi:TniQ family protein [Burkholderia ubonensis]|uniref:TniQ family protein n=1 Tax=Burkholderia ubonensis TaxID=101571 RepID=UPI0009B462CA|nr:TniQ family protein [Burkholderia ubonensis]